MLKKYWPYLVLIILILLGLFIYRQIDNYKKAQQERLAAMQKKAEEVQVTIIEGWTLNQIAQKFEQAELFSAKNFLQIAKDYDYSVRTLITKPSNTTLEGYLFPDTYRFAKGASPTDVITKMLENFSRRLTSIGITVQDESFTIPGYESLRVVGGDGSGKMTLYNLLTLASIIEREGGGKGPMSLAEERALIAGVFYNRLAIGQGLESDATVNYITGKNTPGVSLRDTEINSPYNTYRYAGLPPGPIGSPSLGSIQAALKPVKSDYYYFLHKQPSGEVVFNKTFEAHVRAKQ